MSMTAEAPARPGSRDLSLDVAKGIGIILLVIGHAWRGLDSAGMIGNPDLFRLIDRLIYNFHMPLFFLLSGMTFQAWALRRPLGEAAASRFTRLIWPLILWTYLFAAARLAAGDAANTQVGGWQSLAFLPLPPRDHFWFLWALFLQHLAVLGLIRLVTGPLSAPAWALLAAVAVLASSLTPVGLNAWTHGALTYAGAFLAGLALGQRPWRPTGAAAPGLAVLAFVGLQVLSFQLPPTLMTAQLLGIALSLAALVMVQALTAAPVTAAPRLLAWLGVSSMGIYLAHTIFSAGTRAVLGRLTQDLALHMVAGTLAGIIGPLILYALIRRVGRPAWIGF
ncbi:acyltransferase family protein [Rhodobacter calidifons]|uniref:Acyltransferase n=1 Tax=Rhodobacter calidifons TaxID=2715277 RepID=A0ABX0G8S3_9RHOB|nr:acyltransferase [Rhodobacter calidifons]NHB77332.1 acyltransferase [Rhodobacter calidifons]